MVEVVVEEVVVLEVMVDVLIVDVLVVVVEDFFAAGTAAALATNVKRAERAGRTSMLESRESGVPGALSFARPGFIW